ncbi:Alcohol dehydrogenase class-3 [Lemmus lemmus]
MKVLELCVESIGEGVTKIKAGDSVIPFYFCLNPKTNLCQNSRSVVKSFCHFTETSTFSEYTVVADVSAAKIDPTAPLDKACLLGCGISTGYSTPVNTAKVETVSICSIFVLEAGELAVIMECKVVGAFQIIDIHINKDKFSNTKACGSSDCINTQDFSKPTQEVLTKMPDGRSGLLIQAYWQNEGHESSPPAGQCGGWLSCFRRRNRHTSPLEARKSRELLKAGV